MVGLSAHALLRVSTPPPANVPETHASLESVNLSAGVVAHVNTVVGFPGSSVLPVMQRRLSGTNSLNSGLSQFRDSVLRPR